MGAVFLVSGSREPDKFDEGLIDAMRVGFIKTAHILNCSWSQNAWQCSDENRILTRILNGKADYEVYEKSFNIKDKKYTFQVMVAHLDYDKLNYGHVSYLKIFGGEQVGEPVAEFEYENGIYYSAKEDTDQQFENISQAMVDAVYETVGIRPILNNLASAGYAIGGVHGISQATADVQTTVPELETSNFEVAGCAIAGVIE